MGRNIEACSLRQANPGILQIEFLFQEIYGSELSGERADKAALIAHTSSNVSLDPSDGQIGDRAYDVPVAARTIRER